MAATQVTYVMGTAEMKTREPPDYGAQVKEKPQFMDGKCTCCPYGYHIDLDFVNYCESMANGGTLKNLRRIQRTKRNLRKSMEMMLQQQESPTSFDEMSTPPPDVVHSTEASRLMNMIQYEQSATHHVLQKIDTTVESRIDNMVSSSGRRKLRYASSDSDDNYYVTKQSQYRYQGGDFNGESMDSSHIATSLSTSGRTDSLNSLSSVSTMSNEYTLGQTTHHTMQCTGMLSDQDYPDSTQKYRTVTSAELAATVEEHMPTEMITTVTTTTDTTESDSILISRSSLQKIRESVAHSLQRSKELEEQVKAIPILQLRISVLKEEKRMLMLQAKANANKTSVYNCKATATVDNSYEKMTSSPRSFDFHISPRSASPVIHDIKTPPAVSPKPRVRNAGVGDHTVTEPYLLQPSLPTGYTIHDNHVLNEIRSSTYQEVIHSPRINVNHIQRAAPKAMTRSIGVGDYQVNESTVQIHEKELRTVFFGGAGTVSKRNVGIECRAPTRDVGVMYVSDHEKPSTRTVGINVDTGSLLTSLSFKREELSSALREVLHHSVRSIGITCNMQPQLVSKGTMVDKMRLVSVGCGDDRIDIEIRPATAKRSIAVMAFPNTANKTSSTDKGWILDASTNTPILDKRSKGTSTEKMRINNVGTNTNAVSQRHQNIGTDVKVFLATHQLKHTSSNTAKTTTHSVGSNTHQKPLTEENFDVDVSFYDKKEESDEEIREDYEEIITKTKFYEQVPVNNSSVKSYTTTDRSVLDSPSSNEYSRTTRTSSIPVATHGSSSSSSSTSSSSTGSNKINLSGGGSSMFKYGEVNVSSPTSLYDTDELNESVVTETTTTTVQQPSELLTRGYSIVREQGQIDHTDFASSHITQAKEGIQTNPNPYDYGNDFSSIRSMRRRYPMDTTVITSPEPRRSLNTYSSHSTTSSSSPKLEHTDIEMTEEDVEKAEGYTRYLKLQGGESESRTKTITTEDLGIMDDLDETERVVTTTTVRSVNNGDGGKSNFKSSRNKFSNLNSVNMKEFMNTGENSTVMETSSDSGFGSGYSLTKNLRRSFGDEDNNLDDNKRSSGGEQSFYALYTNVARGGGGLQTSSSFDSHSLSGDENRFDSLKSCIKRSKSDAQSKRGITFADSVVGGTGLSSDESDRDSDSDSASYDEGSYDGRHGRIVYKCQDDEVIASGVPGAQMFDQNIRETFDLSDNMRSSCDVLANYLEDSTTVQTRQLNSSTDIIKREWFKVTNNNLANAYEIEDYMSSFNEISRSLLRYIVNMIDVNGNTALHYAVSHCNFEVVSLLLDTEACELDKPNKAGYTAIMLAALVSDQTSSQRQIVQRLFSKGDINARSSRAGQTALMLAVSHGRANMVRLLLDAGADVNQRDDDGSTALMCACEHGHTDIVKILLGQHDCDASLTDNDGSTALEIAMEAGSKDIGVILYAHVNFTKPLSPAGILRTHQRKTSN